MLKRESMMMTITPVDQTRCTVGTTTRKDLVQGKMGMSLGISPNVRLARNTIMGNADLTPNPSLRRDVVEFANPRSIRPPSARS